MSSKTHYPTVPHNPSYPEIEREVLASWQKDDTFRRSLKSKTDQSKRGEYVFYDGPPFANGLPHYGHLLTGFIKDIIPRFQTMRGSVVERRFGWDCHGLPAELATEKELNISGRQAIEEYGIENFNAQCRTSVLKYTNEWQMIVERQARWVDFENDYKTMDLPYMESVLWAFKTLHEKGLIYQGYRVMPYSWAVESPLSNFETRLDNSYRERQDPAVTVAFKLIKQPQDPGQLELLVWTTTPWTLPSNLAIAVGSDLEYSVIAHQGRFFVIASARRAAYEKELEGGEVVATMQGADLAGRFYDPLFPFFSDHKASFCILEGDFVSIEDGTGSVHLAPGFGEDDQRVCEANGIAIVCPVDSKGRFTGEVPPYKGQLVFDANKSIIRELKDRGVVIKHESYLHNYPHCWRTDTPLIYRAISSWYVKVTDFKDRMVELNQQINWIPEHIRDGQFGKWLESARDWSISRTRYWGTPIPVWQSDDPAYPRVDVYGSIAEIEEDFGVKVKDLHRPFVDELIRSNPDDPTGRSMMRRVPEVFDCWFESGSMPFAQIHYPFENKEWFEDHFPADFIVEYVAQTRGWFYTLMVLATALFDRPPFQNCMCHGVVLDEDGKKLSKRLRNYPDPEEVFSTHGADALRWFLVSSAIIRGGDLLVDRDGKGIGEVVRSVINPLWNAYYFFSLYANSDGIKASTCYSSPIPVDRYVLAKTGALVRDVTESMGSYDIPAACQYIIRFSDVLNNWFIRRSRDRFWKKEKDADKHAAYDTLYTVLTTLCQVAAPLLPLVTEKIYRGLTGEESVHLTEWPDQALFPVDDQLMVSMDTVREVCSAGLSLRESHNLRTRLPLRQLVVAGPGITQLRPFIPLIQEELNVKEIILEESFEHIATFQLHVNARAAGPRLGQRMKDILAASKRGEWSYGDGGLVTVLGETLKSEEFSLRLVPRTEGAASALTTRSAVIVLDIIVTQELEEEGLARDFVRAIQQARKEADLHVSDNIDLHIETGASLGDVLKKYKSFISDQTLARDITINRSALVPLVQPTFETSFSVGKETVNVVLFNRVSPWRAS
jgi:isoleucyl-tRNA synthetase